MITYRPVGKSYGEGSPASAAAQRLAQAHGRRLLPFAFAGVMGASTTLGGTLLLYQHLHLPLWMASAIAIQTAILVTFTLNSTLTWRDRISDRNWHRLAVFEGVSLVGLGIQELALLVGVDELHFFYLLALLAGTGLASVWNYLVNNQVTFAAA